MSRQERIEQYLAAYEKLPPEEQRLHMSVALKWIVWRLLTIANERTVDAGPNDYKVHGE